MIFIEKISESLISSFLVSDVSESLKLLTKNEWCEQIAQVAHQKWAMWANRSGRSPKMSDVSKSLRSLTKNAPMRESLIFSQKTSDSLRKPMSKFPALQKCKANM